EEKLSGWTEPSSSTERDKLERTERMIREAVWLYKPFDACSINVFAKGSYANNTNVRADRDVDIAVECADRFYWEAAIAGSRSENPPYTGSWTPQKFREELGAALESQFPGQVSGSGSSAFHVNSGAAGVDAHVVPCFSYRFYFSKGGFRRGTKIFTTT